MFKMVTGYFLVVATLMGTLPIFGYGSSRQTSPQTVSEKPLRRADYYKKFDLKLLAAMPVLHDGRLKPLDSLARAYLLMLNGKQKVEGLSAMEWLTELLFDDSQAFQRRCFNISNPDVVNLMGLEWTPKHRFNFHEVSEGLRKNEKLLRELFNKDRKLMTLVQRKLFDVYSHHARYFELSRSFSLIKPNIEIRSDRLAAKLGLEAGKSYTYMELLRFRKIFEKGLAEAQKKKKKVFSAEERELLEVVFQHNWVAQDAGSAALRVIPPQWEENNEVWFSPWSIVQSGRGSPTSARLFKGWRAVMATYVADDAKGWSDAVGAINSQTFEVAKGLAPQFLLKLEQKYNAWDLFTKSLVFYILGFLLLVISWVIWPTGMYRAAVVSIGLGVALHTIGIVLRMIIMSRPPVSTLYESVIFVGLTSAVFGLLYEKVRRNGLGLLIASLVGAALHFIGFGYADSGDSMGMLVAVLNSNFWLATHVVTISIGYGCCLVAGVVGHIYLIRRAFNPDKTKLADLYKNMVGITLFALFFAMFGTILGGIWADQSWGRFWGWDPKENGALLIVLWLLVAVHGRISGQLKALGYAVTMVITNIMVAVAWFGVNLLSVGLHSYGFTDSIAMNLGLFCGGEALFALGMWVYITIKELKVEQKGRANV